MNEEYKRFLDPEVQHDNYIKLGIDKSIVEVNQKLFWEKNQNFYEMKEKYKHKSKGVQLTKNRSITEFVEKGEKKESVFAKFKKPEVAIKLPLKKITSETTLLNDKRESKGIPTQN